MGGAITDTFTEIVTLGSADTKTYNKKDVQDKQKVIDAQYEADTILFDENLREEKINTELRERMQTGGYRSLIGGATVKDTVAEGTFKSELDKVSSREKVGYDNLATTLL